jgi:RimJ/RimL family protein N-acetyltransferase
VIGHDEVVLPVSDGIVTVRPFGPADRDALVAGRDAASRRWLGPGSADASPTACIEVDGATVGWVDADASAAWLDHGEVNLGYNVFPDHRGRGYASRAVRLLLDELHGDPGVVTALFVIDPDNAPSHRVAGAVGAQRAVDRTYPHDARQVVYAVELSGPRSP